MSKTINILITIDTDAVKKHYQNPSQDSTEPTGIAHNYGFMVATGTVINSGQGTGDLNITALVGDNLRAFATSGSNNFEDGVLLYGMPKFSGDQVLSEFQYQNFTKSTVIPNSTTTPLPAKTADYVFWFYEADVIKAGQEGYRVQFGLYTRSQTTGEPELYGYFEWDPTIIVAG
ncbi:inclusion body family protein [Synechococcus sp. PCC 7336]|uniref:inclusion body family protein n=1 Tax=Synechococcus sp. PCC 7336 TaxID=195250 RepID=UPI00036D4FCB|nr:inclusion body family protein [Synechococcus sp. PCC 7336]